MTVSEPTPRTQPFITLKYIQFLSTAIVATLAVILGISYAPRRNTQQGVDSFSTEGLGGFQDNQFGLLELAPGLNPAVDIVAVHGLDGHRLHSWTAGNGVCWLRDLLRVSEARIFTYGYDANTRGREQLSSQSLYSHAQSLISSLALERQATATEVRPIIFVAHSLGGIVLKNALVHAHLASKENLFAHKAVALSTYGIIFLGTPHQGTQSAEFASILLNIQSITRPVNDALVKHLWRNSEALEQQLSQFVSISKDFVIKFGFETYPTYLVGGFGDLIVDRASAVVPGTVDAEAISINKDHVNMSKFPSAEDEDFKTISKHLSIMAKAAPHKIAKNWEHQTDRRRPDEIYSGPKKEFCSLPALPYGEGAKAFVGRRDLLNLLHTKFSEDHIVALTGIGGIGKTRAAVEYIYKHRHDFCIVLWVNADTKERIRLDFVKIAQQLIDCELKATVDKNKSNPDNRPFFRDMKFDGLVDDRGRLSTEDDRVIEAVKAWLSQERSGAWLLVFDNADDLDTVPLREFFPTMINGRGTRILITSRDQESAGFGTGLLVPPLNESEAVSMLLHHARREFKTLDEFDHDILKVVRKVGYLPLAIEQAGAYIAAHRLPFSKYLDEYMTHWKLIFGRKRKATVGDYPRNILVTWETSFRQIESHNPYTASFLLACAFLGHFGFPEELARTHALLVDQDLLYREVLDPLFTYSLARPSDDGGSFSVHPLVHVWALKRQDEKQQRTNKAQAAHLLSGAFSLHGDHTPANLKQMVIPTIFVHVFVFVTHLSSEAIGNEDPSIISSLDNIGDECMHHALFSQAFHLRSLVVRWYEINHGWEHPITPFSKNILGVTSMSIGMHELAESLFTTSWNVLSHAQHPAMFILLNNLAASFVAQGWLGKAIGYLEHALGGLEKLAKVGYPAAHSNIQTFKVLYEPNISDAAPWRLERISWITMASPVEILMMRQGSLDPNEFTAENPYISSILASMDQLAPVVGYGPEEVLLRFIPATHTSNFMMAQTFKVLFDPTLSGVVSSTIRRLGRFPWMASPVEVLMATQRSLDPTELMTENPYIFSILASMGRMLTMAPDVGYGPGEVLLRLSLDGRKKTLGPEHPDTLLNMVHLGDAYLIHGRIADAEDLYRQSLVGRERVLGPDHSETLRSITYLSDVLGVLGKEDEAEVLLRRTIKRIEKLPGEAQLHTIKMCSILANILEKRDGPGAGEDAKLCYTHAVAKFINEDLPGVKATVDY